MVLAFKKLNEQLLLSPNIKAILLNGSLAWGIKQSINGDSDIDVDLIVDSEIGRNNSYLGEVLGLEYLQFNDIFWRLYSKGKADYSSWRFSLQGEKFGIDLIPFDRFRFVCDFPFSLVNRTRCLKEYRLFPKDKLPIYCQRNFIGETISYKSRIKKIPEGQITFTPLTIIKNGSYYNGLLPDKYITCKIFSTRSGEVNSLILTLKRNLFLRMKYEIKIGLNGEKANLVNLVYAKEMMSRSKLQRLVTESDRLYKQLLDERLLERKQSHYGKDENYLSF